MNLNRDQAFEILKKYTKSESLIKHAFAVEGVMRHFAKLYNEDIEKWGIIGLLHDIDYEMYPSEHCKKAVEILNKENIPSDYITSIISHGYGIVCDVKPEKKMEKVLYTIDELTGLIAATALMRPTHSVMDLELKSVKKKWKNLNFAKGANRSIIESGASDLGEDLDFIINETILGMREVHDKIGL